VAVEFAKGLIVSEVVSADALERALYVAVSNDSPVEHALLDTGALTTDRLDDELARGDAPVLHDVVADPDLLDRLPAGLCSRLLAVPLRLDVRSNTVDVAVVNVFDTHAAEEIAFHLQANVVAVRASLEDVERALRDRPSYAALSGRSGGAAAAKPHAAPALRHPETPPPVPKLISKRTPPWGTEIGTVPDRGSDIPIPLTRRKSMVPEAAPAGENDLAALTYARLGGGLSLPDAALVRSKSSSPAPDLVAHDHGLRIDSLPVAAVEVTRSIDAPQAPSTSRDGSTGAFAAPANEGALPNDGAVTNDVALPTPPDTERGLPSVPSISLRDGPRTLESVPPRPPPVSVRTPSQRPSGAPPPISVRAPSVRPPGEPKPRTTQSFPAPDASQAVAALRTAHDRDTILGIVQAGARGVARRVAIFVAKRGDYVGWSCTPELGDEGELRAVIVPAEAPTLLAWASAEGSYLGPLDPSAHGAILSVMGSATRDVAAVPIRVSGKTAAVIVADELGDTMIGTKRLEEIARAAGDALLRVVRAAKK
jgi:hypothetical protein